MHLREYHAREAKQLHMPEADLESFDDVRADLRLFAVNHWSEPPPLVRDHPSRIWPNQMIGVGYAYGKFPRNLTALNSREILVR